MFPRGGGPQGHAKRPGPQGRGGYGRAKGGGPQGHAKRPRNIRQAQTAMQARRARAAARLWVPGGVVPRNILKNRGPGNAALLKGARARAAGNRREVVGVNLENLC